MDELHQDSRPAGWAEAHALASAAPLPGALREAFAPARGVFRPPALGDYAALVAEAPALGELFTLALGLTAQREVFLERLGALPAPPEAEQARLAWRLAHPYVAHVPEARVRTWWAGLRAGDREALGNAVVPHLLTGFSTSVELAPARPPGVVVETLYQETEFAEDGVGWWFGLVGRMTAEVTHDLERTLALPLAQAIALSVYLRRRDGEELETDGYVAQERQRRLAIKASADARPAPSAPASTPASPAPTTPEGTPPE